VAPRAERQGAWRADTVLYILHPLLDNDRKISNYTTAVTRQRAVNSKTGKVFSVRSVARYTQGQLAVAVSVMSWLVS
jgi:hypothetical protein